MAYLLPHTRDLFRLVADSSSPEPIRSDAQRYASMEIDSQIDELAWLEMAEGIRSATFPGKRELLRSIDQRARHGG